MDSALPPKVDRTAVIHYNYYCHLKRDREREIKRERERKIVESDGQV